MNHEDRDRFSLRRAESTRPTAAAGLVLAAGVLICLGLASCGADVTPLPAAPKVPFSTAAPAPTGGGDTSEPNAAAAFAAQDAADRAKAAAMGASAAAAAPTAAAMVNSRAPNTMSKDQESKAMPLPGQANDHSTPTRDKKLVK